MFQCFKRLDALSVNRSLGTQKKREILLAFIQSYNLHLCLLSAANSLLRKLAGEFHIHNDRSSCIYHKFRSNVAICGALLATFSTFIIMFDAVKKNRKQKQFIKEKNDFSFRFINRAFFELDFHVKVSFMYRQI